MTAAIVHYNTPELTGALVRSLRKWSPSLDIAVFDNSDRRPFPVTEGVVVFDNTHGALVDFEAMLERYPQRSFTINNHASAKHIASVDALFRLLPDGFLLMDSDVLLCRDVVPLCDVTVPWCGYEERKPDADWHRERLLPYCLWINVPMLRSAGIRFWHDGMVDMLDGTSPYYDTGASLLHDCRAAGLTGRHVDIYEYVVHFGRGSYGGVDPHEWITNNRHLYE